MSEFDCFWWNNYDIFDIFDHITREFNGSVKIPESYDFRSQLQLLNIIFQPSFFFSGIYVLNKKFFYKQIRDFKDCQNINQNEYDFKLKKPNASNSG